MTQSIVLASNNAGKVAEFTEALAPLNITVIPQANLGITDVPETGLTYVENALIKARHAAKSTDLPVLADDSGLSIDTLDGAPGLYSARYAGPDATWNDNIDKVLTVLNASNHSHHPAQFICVSVLLRHENDPLPTIFQGTWQGTIATERRGTNGFGYDPIFIDAESHLTGGEMSPAQKDQVSHRGQVLRDIVDHLTNTVII